jgi:VCBS repeat-containing protein
LLLVNVDGTFAYDPAGRFEFLGTGDQVTDTFTYTVEDAQGGAATAAVSVLVRGINDAPAANPDALSTSEETAVTIDLTANDFDPDGATPVLAGLNDSATVGALTPNADGSVRYDPSGRFDFLAEGEVSTDTFEYIIEDGEGATDTATVTVEVVGVNDAPVAVDDAATTFEDAPIIVNVLGNDADAEGDPRTITALDDAGTLGRVTVNSDGTVTYDPDGRFDALADGETATDTFRYTVSDGNGGTDTATVTVAIDGVDEGGAGSGESVESFEGPIDPAAARGAVSTAFQYDEPDGARDAFSPTDGSSMAVLTAAGASPLSMQFFLGLADPLPADFGDSSNPADGSALRLTVDVAAGDRISFDWMFDANDFVQPPLGDFARPGFNDFATFAADGEGFRLSDIRQVFDDSGQFGASGWRTSIYTAQSDGPLTIGFAVVNDATNEADSHLLVDNIRLNKDFDSESYTIVHSDPSGLLDTVVRNPDI